jgi:YegS/Rv2252/BmrU family lipid kinase
LKDKLNNSNNGDTSLPLVIVNPKSASGATEDRWARTASELRTHFGAFNVVFTKGTGDAIDLALNAALSGRRFIIACGGDGTINEVATGIIRSGTNAELGVLPSGTGGDFRRSLGMPGTTRNAAVALRDGVTRTIDVGKVSFDDLDGAPAERYFLNVSSIGLAAHVIRRVKSTSSLNWLPAATIRGKANFAVSALQEVIGHDPVFIRVRIDDSEEKTLQTLAFCVANARYFGGGMMIAPDAKIDDGLLNIVSIGDISTAKILLNAYSLYKGTHQSLPQVDSATASKIEISAVDDTNPIYLETDGELPGQLPATYEIVTAALKVRVPSGQNREQLLLGS